jgi:multidrug efflux pump subunit AcrA (membrane-fusion protein)
MLTSTLKTRVARYACLGGLTAASFGLFTPGLLSAQERENAADPATLSEKSFTKPSQEVDLDFSAPGLVIEVAVKEGDVVKKDQVLARQDISVESANKKMYDIEANSKVEEEYSKKDLELKKVEHERTEKLYRLKPPNATELEVRKAMLEVERAAASVALATQKRAIAAAQAATEQAKIDLKQVHSPIDGVVEKLDTHVGEVAMNQADRPAFRVVSNDPLWVDAHLPAAVTERLKKGQQLQVRYVAEDKWMPAEVLYLQPKVRPGSQTRMVRLQLANPDDRPAGLEVYVKLPDGQVAANDAAAAAAGAAGESAVQSRAGADR